MVKLIIFDLDGTLVDSLDDLTVAVNHMLAGFGRPALTRTEVRGLVGQGARRLVERALPGGSEAEIERALACYLAYNEAHIADLSRLYAGVAETLAEIATLGPTLAVISNKNVALCRKLLDVLGLGGRFATVLGADSLPERKPSPVPVLSLLREFSVDPADAVIVGDSINDVAAGRGAGIATVGCTYGYGAPDELADADYRVEAFAGLLALPFLTQ